MIHVRVTMSRLGLSGALIVAASVSIGCAHNSDFSYRPAGPSFGGAPAARYPIPPGAPRAEVYVTSFGYADLDVPDRDTDMFHMRLAVVNNGTDVIQVDGRQQGLVAPGQQQPLGAAFLNTDAGTGPVYTVVPGQNKVFDLYFAPPPPLHDARSLPNVEFQWQVQLGTQVYAERTPFERIHGAHTAYAYNSYPAFVHMHLGFGVGWWYGPYYGYRYPPVIRGYYYPPARGYRYAPGYGGGGWRGGSPSGGGGWRGSPSMGGGGWRGSPGGGGFRGGGGGGGWRGRAR
jgi:hypothetical protein